MQSRLKPLPASQCHVQHFIARRPFLLLRLVDPSISEAEAIMVRALMFSFVALASAAVRQGPKSLHARRLKDLQARGS